MAPPSVSPAAPHVDPFDEFDARENERQLVEAAEAPAEGGTIGPAWAHGLLERAPGETDLDLEFDEDAPLAAAIPPSPVSAVLVEPPAELEIADEDDPLEEADVAAHEAEPPVVAEALPDPEPTPEALDEAEPVPESAPEAEPEQEPELNDLEPVVDDALEPQATPAEPTSEPQWPETRAWPPDGATQLPAWPIPEPAQRPRAGAYLPPSALLTTIAEPDEIASADEPRVATAGAAHASVAIADRPSTETAEAGARPRMPGIDPAFPPQVIVVGAGLTSLGFLLPWAAIVIGSGRIGGYLEQWGLAGPGHLILLIAVIALGAAASQVDRLPGWARPGIPALVLTGLLVGILWPYLFGSFQTSIGVYVTLVGALVLGVGAALELWHRRHVVTARPV
jgi:hypothetical protein